MRLGVVVYVAHFAGARRSGRPAPSCRSKSARIGACVGGLLAIGVWAADIHAQDVEPRALAAAPVGTNLVGLTLSYSWGAILLDKTLPVDDLDGYTAALVPSYSRYFSLFGVTSRFDAILPIARGEWDALIEGSPVDTTIRRSGLGDPRLHLAVFILGARAMSPEEFRDYRRKTMLGLFLRVVLPLGQYDESRLINLGSNRWQIVTALGFSHRMGRWTGDAYVGAWFFTDNKSAFGGNVLGQDPLFAFQLNLAYELKPGMWLALGARQTVAGKTTVNGVQKDDPTVNNRVGLVFGIPVARRHTLRLAATTGTSATKGNDYNTLTVGWFVN